ncbi:MAG: zf-TFIIB domain-containing protein [Planctomycetota bacterium]
MICRGCGNDVPDPHECPICLAGRGFKKASKPGDEDCACPRCFEPLQQQDWEGISVLTCPTCRGSFFPTHGLEHALNKLRATCSTVDVATALAEFKDRFTRELPTAVRYKRCPVCRTVMTRRNYRTVSGVIVDVCGPHGTWVDEAAFGELASFITRGGDVVANEVTKIKIKPATPPGSTPNLLERLFG